VASILTRIGRALWKASVVTGYVILNLPWIVGKLLTEGPTKAGETLRDVVEKAGEAFRRAPEVVKAVERGELPHPEEIIPMRDIVIKGRRIAAAPRMPWDLPALALEMSMFGMVLFTVFQAVILPPVMLWEALGVLSTFGAFFSLSWLRKNSPSEEHYKPYRDFMIPVFGSVLVTAAFTNFPPLVTLVIPVEATLPGFTAFGIPAIGLAVGVGIVKWKHARDWTYGYVLEGGAGTCTVMIGHDVAANTLPGEYTVEGDAGPGEFVLVQVERKPFSLTGAVPVRVIRRGWY